MRSQNPFPVYGYLGPDFFCDRERETEKLVEAIENGRNVTLIAPRRLGKTGLVHHVFHRLRASGEYTCIYLDIYAVKTLPAFVSLFAREVFSALETGMEKVVKTAGQFLRSCRPNMTIDAVSGLPSFSFSLDGSAAETTLKETFDYLNMRKEKIVIAIDEFQQVGDFPEGSAEALLRGFIQQVPQVRFIFAGSKFHLMREMFLSAKRPFYKSTQNLSLGTIACETYYAFANRFFTAAGRNLDEAAFARAWRLVDGVTWEVQTVLNRLWAREEKQVGDEAVSAVFEEILAENEEEYRNVLANLSVNDARVLTSVGKAGKVTQPTGREFLQTTGLSASSVSLCLDRLVNAQLVYRDEYCCVYDRFFGLWLQRAVC